MSRRLVLDTNVFVAGLSSRHGASFRLLQLLLDGRYTLLGSPALWLEMEAVLKRDEVTARHGFAPAEIERLLDAFAASVEAVRLHYLWRPQLRDPADEMVLELAVNGRADALVTHNMADFAPAVARFGLRLLRPGECLRWLEELTP